MVVTLETYLPSVSLGLQNYFYTDKEVPRFLKQQGVLNKGG